MSVRDIIQTPNTGGTVEDKVILETPTQQVEDFTDPLRELLIDLQDTMWHHSICRGLAAPQIGIGLRVAVVNWDRNSRDNDLILVNPKIVNTSGKKDVKRESCMSLWGLCGDVIRRDKIVVQYRDHFGKDHESAFEGFPARAIQHEVDHLDGVLYSKRLKSGGELAPTDLFDGESWRA